MSLAGGILVSKNVYDELLSREGFEGVSLGLQSLKGLGRFVEVYALKDAENIEFEVNFRLYQLLEDTLYLETAYKQVQEKASVVEEKLEKKFLNYPIPKQIVEEWEKVNKG